MKVPIDGGKPERFTEEYAETNSGYDIARDGKTIVLGTYDFKAQRPNISLVSLDSGELLRTLEYDPRHGGQLRFSPDGKGIVYPVLKRAWTISSCNRWDWRSRPGVDQLYLAKNLLLSMVARWQEPGPRAREITF